MKRRKLLYLLVQVESASVVILLQELVLSLGRLVRHNLRVHLLLQPALLLRHVSEI